MKELTELVELAEEFESARTVEEAIEINRQFKAIATRKTLLAIADELVWRDMQIAELKAQHDALQEKLELKQNLTEQIVELKKQRDAMAAENAVMLELLTDISEQYQEVQTESEENAAVIDLDYISEVNTYVSRDVDGENPFTATDAYLNSVRADSVEDAAKLLFGQGYTFEVLTRFASKLRAGEPS